MVIWITGLAGSGKTTLGRALYQELKSRGISNVVYLDGDEFREIIGEFGYEKVSRIETAKKRAMLCQMLSNQDLVVISSSISMFQENYDFNRNHIKEYFEVYIQCDMAELKRRNQKNLYSGKIKNVVGLDIAFDEPKSDLILTNNQDESRTAIQILIAEVLKRIFI